jgi:hypothetical protein
VRREAGVGQRLLGAGLALVFGFGLVLTISRGAWLALALVLAAWPALAASGTRWRRLGVAALAAAGVVAVFAVLCLSVPKVRERFTQLRRDAGEVTRPIMWRGAWQIFREHPAWGGGAGSYNALFEKHRPMRYQDEPVWAHNDYLNTLSDYGAVGFVLFFGAGLVLAGRCSREKEPLRRDWLDDPLVAGALVAGLVAFGLQLFVDFHFKLPALAMAFAIVAALAVQRAWPVSAGVSRLPRALGLVVALVVGMIAGGWAWPFYRGEALRYAARGSINRLAGGKASPADQRAVLTQARADLTRATTMVPTNAQAWADLSYVESLWAHLEPDRTAELGRAAEEAADRALALSRVVPEFWIRRGVARDMEGRRNEAGADFVQALTLAPASASAWFYHAYHLSQNKNDPGLALAAVDFCLRLDPSNSDAQSLRQRLASGRRAP